MLSRPRHRLVVAALVVGGVAAVLVYAGPLDPPAGPVASTMKTLDQVEPRTPVNSTTTPGDANSLFRITASGSYYLTGNITGVVGKHGIEIAASCVTLDLMGFSLSGVPGSLDGIHVEGIQSNIVIKNGIIKGWGGSGIAASSAKSSAVGPCQVPDNGEEGASVGDGSQVADVTAEGNGGTGVQAGNNCKLEQIRAANNGGKGINGGDSTTVINCKSNSNQSDGVSLGDGCNIAGLLCRNNTGAGILVGLNGVLTRCTSVANAGDGATLGGGCRITDSTCSNNGVDGIEVGDDCYVTGCACDGNGTNPNLVGGGIHTVGSAARIESNILTDNERGVLLAGAGNVVIRNTFSGNGTPQIQSNGNQVVGEPITTQANPNFSSANAWANLLF